MKKWLIGGGILIVLAAMILVNVLRGDSDDGGSAPRGRSQTVEARVVEAGTITSSIIITGSVEEVTKEEVMATSPVEIKEVMVTKGSVVKKGDKLFTADLDSSYKELDQLKINYDIQLLTMKKLETLSSTTDDRSMELALELARLNRDSAERFLNTQTENLEKNQALFDAGLISKSEFEGLESTVTEAESQLATAKVSYQRSYADLTSIREQTENSELSTEIDLEIQQLNIDSLAMNIETLEQQIKDIEDLTTATLDGVVTELNIEAGDMASTIGPLLVIRDVTDLKIVANIREYDITDVAEGQEVIITGDAIGKEETVLGTVSYIAPVAAETIVNNRQVTAIEVEITVDQGVDVIKPGYTTECEIITSKLEDVVIATYEMLQKDSEDNDIVFVIEEGIAKERIVKLGATSDFDAEVIEGLESGDQVILNPSLSLFDGSKVEVEEEEEGK